MIDPPSMFAEALERNAQRFLDEAGSKATRRLRRLAYSARCRSLAEPALDSLRAVQEERPGTFGLAAQFLADPAWSEHDVVDEAFPGCWISNIPDGDMDAPLPRVAVLAGFDAASCSSTGGIWLRFGNSAEIRGILDGPPPCKETFNVRKLRGALAGHAEEAASILLDALAEHVVYRLH